MKRDHVSFQYFSVQLQLRGIDSQGDLPVTKHFPNNVPVNHTLFWFRELDGLLPQYSLSAINVSQLIFENAEKWCTELRDCLCSPFHGIQPLCIEASGDAIRTSSDFALDMTQSVNVMSVILKAFHEGSRLQIKLTLNFHSKCSSLEHLSNQTMLRCKWSLIEMQSLNNITTDGTELRKFSVPKSDKLIVIEDFMIINNGEESFEIILSHGDLILTNSSHAKSMMTYQETRMAATVDVTNINVFDVTIRHSSKRHTIGKTSLKIRYYVLRDFCQQNFCFANILNLQLALNDSQCNSGIQAERLLIRWTLCQGFFTSFHFGQSFLSVNPLKVYYQRNFSFFMLSYTGCLFPL